MSATTNKDNLTRCVIVNRNVIPVDAPSRILVLPWGVSKRSDGREFIVNESSAQSVVQHFEQRGLDLPIGLEHQTLGGEFASPTGAAPAMGWIKGLEPEKGVGIWANVEWVEQGADYIRSKQYRYLSPVFLLEKTSGTVLVLDSVGLTNKPAISNMKPVVNKEGTDIMGDYDSLLGKLRGIAGVGDDADESAVLQRLEKRVQVMANKENLDDITQYVLREDFDVVMNRAESAEKALEEKLVNDFIESGMVQGKITPANVERWRKIFLVNRESADDVLAVAPIIAPPDGRKVEPAQPGEEPIRSGTRRSVIAMACRDFESGKAEMERITNKQRFVNLRLRDAGWQTLSNDEAEAL